MKTVSFSFVPGLSEHERTTALEKIQSWAGVTRTSAIAPDSADPHISRMFLGALEESADPGEIAGKIRDLPEIETAGEPAQRGLF